MYDHYNIFRYIMHITQRNGNTNGNGNRNKTFSFMVLH